VSYVNPEWPGHLRREMLSRDYGFNCRCPKCTIELEIEKNFAEASKVEDNEKHDDIEGETA
jgi:hypothetical protein